MRPKPSINEHHNRSSSVDLVRMIYQVLQHFDQNLVTISGEYTIDAFGLLALDQDSFDYMVAPGSVGV